MKLWRIILDWIKRGAPKAISTVPAEPAPAWDAFQWPDYMDHGYEGENEMRERGIAACREAGKTILGFKIKRMPTLHVAIEILDFESDKDRGKFIGRFHKLCLAAGITRFLVDISSVTDYAGIADLFKHYEAGAVRYTGADFAKHGKALECDANGIKTSASRLRK